MAFAGLDPGIAGPFLYNVVTPTKVGVFYRWQMPTFVGMTARVEGRDG
jgi:hypothetical protein